MNEMTACGQVDWIDDVARAGQGVVVGGAAREVWRGVAAQPQWGRSAGGQRVITAAFVETEQSGHVATAMLCLCARLARDAAQGVGDGDGRKDVSAGTPSGDDNSEWECVRAAGRARLPGSPATTANEYRPLSAARRLGTRCRVCVSADSAHIRVCKGLTRRPAASNDSSKSNCNRNTLSFAR